MINCSRWFSISWTPTFVSKICCKAFFLPVFCASRISEEPTFVRNLTTISFSLINEAGLFWPSGHIFVASMHHILEVMQWLMSAHTHTHTPRRTSCWINSPHGSLDMLWILMIIHYTALPLLLVHWARLTVPYYPQRTDSGDRVCERMCMCLILCLCIFERECKSCLRPEDMLNAVNRWQQNTGHLQMILQMHPKFSYYIPPSTRPHSLWKHALRWFPCWHGNGMETWY